MSYFLTGAFDTRGRHHPIWIWVFTWSLPLPYFHLDSGKLTLNVRPFVNPPLKQSEPSRSRFRKLIASFGLGEEGPAAGLSSMPGIVRCFFFSFLVSLFLFDSHSFIHSLVCILFLVSAVQKRGGNGTKRRETVPHKWPDCVPLMA